MDDLEKKSAIPRLIISLLLTAAYGYASPIQDAGFAIFLYPLIALAIYVWLGIALFFIDIIWKLIAKPDERLFATIMLTGTVLVFAAIAAAYWLIKDSIGVGATIMYAIGAYCIFAIVRWFRRHTASYYAALEQSKNDQSAATDGHH